MKVQWIFLLGLCLSSWSVSAQDSTQTTPIDSSTAQVYADSLIQLFQKARAVYKLERFDANAEVKKSSKTIMVNAFNWYSKLKHIHGLKSKVLFSEHLFNEGTIASRELRAFPITIQLQKDKTTLYNTNKSHIAICNGTCGKCVTPDEAAIERYKKLTKQKLIE